MCDRAAGQSTYKESFVNIVNSLQDSFPCTICQIWESCGFQNFCKFHTKKGCIRKQETKKPISYTSTHSSRSRGFGVILFTINITTIHSHEFKARKVMVLFGSIRIIILQNMNGNHSSIFQQNLSHITFSNLLLKSPVILAMNTNIVNDNKYHIPMFIKLINQNSTRLHIKHPVQHNIFKFHSRTFVISFISYHFTNSKNNS